jgi:hypothetical protein
MAQEPIPEATLSTDAVCRTPSPTTPTDPGGFGPIWDTDITGALLPSVSIVPRGPLDLWVEVRVFLGGGRGVVGYSEGPLTAAATELLPLALLLPTEIDSTLARVSVHVTATEPETGAPIARAASHAYAYRDGLGIVRLITEEEAKTFAGTGVVQNDTVEDTVVGREVTR